VSYSPNKNILEISFALPSAACAGAFGVGASYSPNKRYVHSVPFIEI